MKKLDEWLRHRFRLVYLLLLLAAAGIYGVFSLNTMVWADEAYTFALIRHSFREVWNITAADVHPPLYYFLLKLLTAPFGYNLLVCRFVSALPCIALLLIGGWQLRKLFGERTAVLFMVLYLLYPYTMDYAAEVRMYSLAELLVMMNAIWAYRSWKWNRRIDWAVFALSGTSAAYTHYFALVSAAMVYGILLLAILIRKRELLKGWALASAATILLFLPWLGSFVSQLVYKVNNEYWIEPITVGTVVNYVETIFSAQGMTAFKLFFALAYAVAFVALLLSRDKEKIRLCLCALAVPLGTVAIGLAASVLVRPVFVIRYILPSIPLMVLFYAYVLGHMGNEMVLSSLLTVAVMGGVSNLLVDAKNAVIPGKDSISAALVENLPEHDAYVVISGNTMHVSQELAYREPETPIYVPDALGKDNPYPNRVPGDSFGAEAHEKIILVLESGDEIPEAYAQSYGEAEYLRDVKVSGTGQSLWYLTKE